MFCGLGPLRKHVGPSDREISHPRREGMKKGHQGLGAVIMGPCRWVEGAEKESKGFEGKAIWFEMGVTFLGGFMKKKPGVQFSKDGEPPPKKQNHPFFCSLGATN